MKRRVLMISPYFYPEGGGLEKYAFDMAMELLSENEVNVLCMTREEDNVEEFNGIRVYRVKPDLIVSNTPLSLRFVLKAAEMVRDADYVVAHTPVPFAADVASFLAKLKRIPLKIVYHTVGLKKGAYFLDVIAGVYSLTLERFTLRGAEIIAVSRTVWEYLRGRGYNSRISLPKATLLKHRHGENCHSRKKAILFVGQLGEYHRFKNLDLIIRAFSELSVEFPEWELWIVGGGDLLEEYKRLVFELGLGSKVKFFGRVERPDKLARIYCSSQILVLPSSFESFGMVVAEALSFRVPVVVSSNVGAKILVVPGKNGFILEDISASALRNVLRKMMGNPKLLRKLSSYSTLL